MPRVYVSIGSNINRLNNIHSALNTLRDTFGELSVSNVYESKAIGFEGDDFYNLVVGFETNLPLNEIIQRLKKIERKHRRDGDHDKFSSRTLDLDVLLYGDLIDHLTPHDVPRAEIQQYAFVLLPLSEIAGEQRHPETGERFADMWRNFSDGEQTLSRIDL